MAKIKRNENRGVRRAARSKGRGAGARRAGANTGGLIDRGMGLLPFTEEQWSTIWLTLIVGAVLALAAVIANIAGVPAIARAQIAQMAADAGFEVRNVRVTGTDRMDERQVYARALGQRERPMPTVEIEQLREDLLALPWVEDARVSTQFPSTLAIDIVERVPHAVLEKPDRMMLIDASGSELQPISREDASEMLRITGPGAARQVGALDRLLSTAPALSSRVERAEWVGNRRWNLTFRSGQVLALPEGDDEAGAAMIKFARMDGRNRLLGGKVATFDMRSPPRIYMRVPGRADRIELGAQGEQGNP